jgi:hypothetical protein
MDSFRTMLSAPGARALEEMLEGPIGLLPQAERKMQNMKSQLLSLTRIKGGKGIFKMTRISPLILTKRKVRRYV